MGDAKHRESGFYWVELRSASPRRTIARFFLPLGAEVPTWEVPGVSGWVFERPTGAGSTWITKVWERVHNPMDGPSADSICLAEIFEAMWPHSDPDAEWGGDTLDRIYDAMAKAGLIPERDKAQRKLDALRTMANEWDYENRGYRPAASAILQILDRK